MIIPLFKTLNTSVTERKVDEQGNVEELVSMFGRWRLVQCNAKPRLSQSQKYSSWPIVLVDIRWIARVFQYSNLPTPVIVCDKISKFLKIGAFFAQKYTAGALMHVWCNSCKHHMLQTCILLVVNTSAKEIVWHGMNFFNYWHQTTRCTEQGDWCDLGSRLLF